MSKFSKNIISLAVAGCLVAPFSAMATNGMNPEGTGVKNRGMGGAGVAMANETASVTNNPGAVVDVGERLDAALGVFSPKPRGYTLTGNGGGFSGSQESGSNEFLIPYFGMSFPIDNESAWSFVINANGGMNVDYDQNFNSGFTNSTGINLAQVFVNGTYGRKVSDGVSVGVTVIYAYQTFEAKGLDAFKTASSASDSMTDNGEDTSSGIGFKFGIRADLGDGVTIGAAYQPKVDMSEFEKYKGLFADQGDLDIAATLSAGIAWEVSPALTMAFDYLYIDYADVGSIGNSAEELTVRGKPFGSSGGPGFGWESINVFKLGAEYKYSDELILRAGWNHGDNPIKSSEVSVNFLAPGTIEDHLTLGATNKLTKDSELSFNYVHSFENSVSGDFATAFGGGDMTISMEQNFFEVGYSKLF